MPLESDIVVKVLMQLRAELIGYAWLVVGNPDTAEDVFQDVSVLAIRKREEINDTEHLVGWLYAAIRLRGLEVSRRNRKANQMLGVEVLKVLERMRSQLSDKGESEKLSALRECINQMQGEIRRVLELRYGQNLKPTAIAEQTGKQIHTVYKTLTRATVRCAIASSFGLRSSEVRHEPDEPRTI